VDAPIKVIKEFISTKEICEIIEYIDMLESTMGDKFIKWQDGRRLALQFGVDYVHEKSSHPDLEFLGDGNGEMQNYFSKVIKTVKTVFDVPEDLHMSSFWFAKQYPGAIVNAHEDTDSGYNMHYKYSGVLYLNTMTDGGELFFAQYDHYHKPEAGDLVLFPSQGTGMHSVDRISETRYSLVFWMTDIESMGIKKG
jgi:hypothetical protein